MENADNKLTLRRCSRKQGFGKQGRRRKEEKEKEEKRAEFTSATFRIGDERFRQISTTCSPPLPPAPLCSLPKFPLMERVNASGQSRSRCLSPPLPSPSSAYPLLELSLKLLIDNQSNKVLFGEASKDVVDFLFSLLALPLGTVTKLLTKDAMVGSIGEVHHSLSKLNETYILSNEKVSSLLNPSLASTSNLKTNFLLPPSTHQDTKDRRFYICSNTTQHRSYNSCCAYVSEVQGVTCPRCSHGLNTEATFVEPNSDASVVEVGSDGKGYVKGVVTYSLMDDLTVVPMSTISSIALLNKFQIKDLGSLEEKTVNIGLEEGLKLLRASLETKTVLTDVFLKRKIVILKA